MTLLALTAEQVSTNGKAWVDAVTSILATLIGQVGVLALAAIAVYQNINKQLPQELKERLDRQAARIDQVALAAIPANGTPIAAEIVNREPIPVTEETKP